MRKRSNLQRDVLAEKENGDSKSCLEKGTRKRGRKEERRAKRGSINRSYV